MLEIMTALSFTSAATLVLARLIAALGVAPATDLDAAAPATHALACQDDRRCAASRHFDRAFAKCRLKNHCCRQRSFLLPTWAPTSLPSIPPGRWRRPAKIRHATASGITFPAPPTFARWFS